jgi:hypothetical protein
MGREQRFYFHGLEKPNREVQNLGSKTLHSPIPTAHNFRLSAQSLTGPAKVDSFGKIGYAGQRRHAVNNISNDGR